MAVVSTNWQVEVIFEVNYMKLYLMRHLEIKLGHIAVYTISSENRDVLRSHRQER